MLAIEVEFLMGRAVATDASQRERAEWPPHPQRLFSALVATHFELGLGSRTEAALKWLESLPPPEIRADTAPALRSPLSHWVPVNDESVRVEKGRTDFRHALDRRNRQERFFPTVVPRDPVVVFQWPDASGIDEHRNVLSQLVHGLSYIGHSTSPVRGCLRDVPAVPTLFPSAEGDYALRVPSAGRFERLRRVHELRLEEESIQPPLGLTQRYTTRNPVLQGAFSADALVLAFDDGPKLSLDSALPLMQHLRHAVLSRLGQAIPEVLSGHDRAGNATADAHLAFVPLAFVGSKHADGSVKGAALVLPRTTDDSARRRLRMALLAPWELHLGPLGSISMRLSEDSARELQSLRFDSYARSSPQWASVTPVFLDKHPKKGKLSPEQIIGESCVRAGLPYPADIRIGPVSALLGVPPAREFRGSSKQTDHRVRQHALLRFDKPVRGPLLLGAGRFMGLGTFLPFRGTAAS